MKIILQKPLMLAYISFIGVCCVWYIICQIIGWGFENWNKIVVAVTLASYFFSISSIEKLKYKQEERNKELFTDEINLCKRMKKALTKEKDAIISKSIDELIEDCNTSLLQTNDTIYKFQQSAFVWDALGYLLFFVVLGIDGVYKQLSVFTEFVTLLAFMVILLVDYLESAIMVNYEERRKAIRHRSIKTLETLESID